MLVESTHAQSPRHRAILVAVVVVGMLSVVAVPSARGQERALVSPAVLGIATDVVDGRVIVVQSIDTGTGVHTLVMVDVERSLEGTVSGQVLVEVPGGTSATGVEIAVSHQPQLTVGASVQLALIRATAEEEAALTGGLPVYSIVGGTRGVAALEGSVPDQTEGGGFAFLPGNPKWETFPIPYVINPAGSGISAANTIGAIRGAVQQWVDDPGSDVTFTYGGTTTATADDYVDDLNTIGWLDTPSAADIFIAQAVYGQIDGVMYEVDIQINRDYPLAWGAVAGRHDLETIVLHELGHALGLAHSTASVDDVMYPAAVPNFTMGLGPGDRAGIAALYPAGSGLSLAAESEFFLNFDWDNRHDLQFVYGPGSSEVLVGDWDGDGADELAVRSGNGFAMNLDNDSSPDVVVQYGRANDVVVVGDWDGDGVDELAIRRGNAYYLNFDSDASHDALVLFGRANDAVLVGDWDGDGVDELAIRRGNRYFLNFDGDASHDALVLFGRANDAVLVGDWDGDGVDELAIRRGNAYYLNFDTDGFHDLVVHYGRSGDDVIVGDWDGDGTDELGIRR